ncbi:MAG TPA: MATE family efflux transporter [Candidatus Butyricicoccus stercorigallinarum]|nr:MATE family efflux transporter [Candidatus Butyricicoccus stercorigallinarum]
MIRDKAFYKTFAILTLSIALQNLLTYSVNLADNIMVGRYSQDALSGVSLCNQFQFFLQMLVVGVSEGIVVLGARYWGKKELKPIPSIIGCGLRFGCGMAAVLFVLALLFPRQIIGLMTNDAAVAEQAVQYLRIICFTYILFALTNMLASSLRAIGIVKIGYLIAGSTLCINIVLNYILIYGHFGAPAMGVRGAAIATLVSRTVELLIVLWYLKYREHTLRLTLKKLICIDHRYMADYVRISLPLLVTQALWGINSIFQTAIIGNMDDAASVLPANSISVIVYQIISVIGYGAASAAAIVTGRTLGEHESDPVAGIRPVLHTLQIVFLVIGVLTGAVLFLSQWPILLIYNTLTPRAAQLTRQFITVLAVTTVGTCYQMATDCGFLRAGGDTKFCMINNNIWTWLICLPCAFLSAFVFHFPPAVVFFCLKMDQLGKCPVVFLRIRSFKWIHSVTR